jgi:hypothetical protein
MNKRQHTACAHHSLAHNTNFTKRLTVCRAPHTQRKTKKTNKDAEQKKRRSTRLKELTISIRKSTKKLSTLSNDPRALQKSATTANSVCFAAVTTLTNEPRGGRDSTTVAQSNSLSATSSHGVHVDRSLSGIAARFDAVSSVTGATHSTPAVASNVFDTAMDS